MFNLIALITATGYAGLFGIVFAETGLFFGFFLPGDSLLFTAGFLASQGVFNIVWLLPLLFAAAVLGDSVGYAFGKKVGPALFAKKESRFFKPAHLQRAHGFFITYGKKAVILARFIPVIRTFIPIVAGVADMPYRQFLSANVFGGALWVGLVLLAGYFLGRQIPSADTYLYPIIGVIIIISFVPVVREWLKARKKKLR